MSLSCVTLVSIFNSVVWAMTNPTWGGGHEAGGRVGLPLAASEVQAAGSSCEPSLGGRAQGERQAQAWPAQLSGGLHRCTATPLWPFTPEPLGQEEPASHTVCHQSKLSEEASNQDAETPHAHPLRTTILSDIWGLLQNSPGAGQGDGKRADKTGHMLVKLLRWMNMSRSLYHSLYFYEQLVFFIIKTRKN